MEVRIGYRTGKRAKDVPTARLEFQNKFSRKTRYSEIRRAMVAGKYSTDSENLP